MNLWGLDWLSSRAADPNLQRMAELHLKAAANMDYLAEAVKSLIAACNHLNERLRKLEERMNQ